MSFTENHVEFEMTYWRSKFMNSCDASQNVDTEVTPFGFGLPYEINKGYNAVNGGTFWELKFTNPDGSTFSFYRK
jgi:hypothetical protein